MSYYIMEYVQVVKDSVELVKAVTLKPHFAEKA